MNISTIKDRMTVREAAMLLAKAINRPYSNCESMLNLAIHTRTVATYRQGSDIRNRFEELNCSGDSSIVRIDEDEVYITDLDKWLDQTEPRLKWRYQQQDGRKAEIKDKPQPKMRWQEDVVIKLIELQRLTPTRIPRYEIGKRNSQKSIIKTLAASEYKISGSSFDHTWDRLLKDGRLKYEAREDNHQIDDQ